MKFMRFFIPAFLVFFVIFITYFYYTDNINTNSVIENSNLKWHISPTVNLKCLQEVGTNSFGYPVYMFIINDESNKIGFYANLAVDYDFICIKDKKYQLGLRRE